MRLGSRSIVFGAALSLFGLHGNCCTEIPGSSESGDEFLQSLAASIESEEDEDGLRVQLLQLSTNVSRMQQDVVGQSGVRPSRPKYSSLALDLLSSPSESTGSSETSRPGTWNHWMLALAVLPQLVGPLACFWLLPRSHEEMGKKEEVGDESPQSLRHLVSRVWQMWLMHVAGTFFNAVALPSMNYLYLDNFARFHTDLPAANIHCETDMKLPFCQAAVPEVMKLSVVLGLAAPIVHLLFGPTLGALSDSYGRKPIIIVIRICRLIAMCANYAVSWFGLSIWWSIILAPFGMIPIVGIPFAWYIERIGHAPTLTVAIGIIEGSCILAGLAGTMLGKLVSMRMAFAICAAGYLAMLPYTVFVLPESLSSDRMVPLDVRKLLPGVAVRVIFQSSFALKVCISTAIANFQMHGWELVATRFFQEHLFWNRDNTYVFMMSCSVFQFACLFFGTGLLFKAIGQKGILIIAFGCANLATVFAMLSKSVLQGTIAGTFFMGATCLPQPVVYGLMSMATPPGEQGATQSSMELFVNVAQALGPLAFATMYEALDSPASGWKMDVYIVYTCLFSLPALSLLLSSLNHVEDKTANRTSTSTG
eukprot:TRINITY_DN72010_c0_g1_i1.p1 TRINITY_DN72010_c0_g1~~TRINITY_DN72010_c0_g1_i1.p1  ORF type:complete len:592 (+),score=75.13 TRINITY_DN72010_c0_g1_i1:206-1981(+)